MSFLEEIVSYKKDLLKEKKTSYSSIKKELKRVKISQNTFKKALQKQKICLIAEIKMASPSKGDLSLYSLEEIAAIYQKCSVDCVSVLTEDKYFKGSVSNIKRVKEIYKGPVLMKDFIISEYQIYEGIIAGADAVLLIAAILTRKELKKFLNICRKFNIAALVEVHSEVDLEKCRGLKHMEVFFIAYYFF